MTAIKFKRIPSTQPTHADMLAACVAVSEGFYMLSTESDPHRRIRLESEARTRQGNVKGDVCPSLCYHQGEIVYCDVPVDEYGIHEDGIDAHGGLNTARMRRASWNDNP